VELETFFSLLYSFGMLVCSSTRTRSRGMPFQMNLINDTDALNHDPSRESFPNAVEQQCLRRWRGFLHY
jgi:hypothetical protein